MLVPRKSNVYFVQQSMCIRHFHGSVERVPKFDLSAAEEFGTPIQIIPTEYGLKDIIKAAEAIKKVLVGKFNPLFDYVVFCGHPIFIGMVYDAIESIASDCTRSSEYTTLFNALNWNARSSKYEIVEIPEVWYDCPN